MTAKISGADLDALIIGYLPHLEDEQKTALLAVIEAFAPPQDHWADPEFVAEMERRQADYETGRNVVSFSSVEEAMNHFRVGKKG